MFIIIPRNCLILWLLLACSSFLSASRFPSNHLLPRQAIARPNALQNFEVREPPVVPSSKPCDQVLLQHTFANSYGQPANVHFSPPVGCGKPGSWASVVFNLTGTSIGTQYDRLARLYLKDIEVWRTSTAEPTKTGIIWTVTRDMTKYIPLLSTSGPLSLELNNIVNKELNLNGNFEITLSAKFYPPTTSFPATQKADQIVNLGRGVGNNVTSLTKFPQNLASAFVEIFASGNSQEEFWYTNPPDEYMDKIDPGHTGNVAIGKGPFREIQVWIDGSLAGVAYPFPVIYTGGILLSLWRPIAAIGAFDSPTYVIDITPFIPQLTDSKPHNLTIKVEGEGPNGSINTEWFLSGSVFMKLDPSQSRTTGKMIHHSTDSKTSVVNLPSPKSSKSSLINFQVKSFRKLDISSTIVTGSGVTKTVKFHQDLTFSNQQSWLPGGDYLSVSMSSGGISRSTHDDQTEILDQFDFPMHLITTQTSIAQDKTFQITSNLTHGYERTQILPLSTSLGKTDVKTRQISSGELKVNSNGRAIDGIARTSQTYEYQDELLNSPYKRDVEIFNVTKVIRDIESGAYSITDMKEGYESANSLVQVTSIFDVPSRTLHPLHTNPTIVF